MTAVHEVATGLSFLISTLQADATLATLAPGGISRSIAPTGTATPVIIVSLQSGIDVVTANGIRLMVSALYQVKAVGPSSTTQAIVNAASQLDTVLGGNQGLRNVQMTGGYILSCVRESPIAYDDTTLVVGQLWTYIGGMYRIQVEQSP